MVKKLKALAAGKRHPARCDRSVNPPTRSGSPASAPSPRRRKKAARSSRPWSRKARPSRTAPRRSPTTRSPKSRSKATGNWDKLEQVFEDRVARALHSLSVPTRKRDIDDLSAACAELTAATKKLSAAIGASRRDQGARGGQVGRAKAESLRREPRLAPAARTRRTRRIRTETGGGVMNPRKAASPWRAAARSAASTKSARWRRSTRRSSASISPPATSMSA